MQKENQNYVLDGRIKELTPGIQTQKERESFRNLSSNDSQNINQTLFYRMMQK